MMARSGLRGTYQLTEKGLNENVTRQLPGAYALGRAANGKFYIDYVGRSDSDVKKTPARSHRRKFSVHVRILRLQRRGVRKGMLPLS